MNRGMEKLGEILPRVVGELCAVTNISQRSNPGDTAVACSVGGSVAARRIGHATNCQAALFAVELALDVEPSRPLVVTSCITHVMDLNQISSRKVDSRDADVYARIHSKLNGARVIHRKKVEDPRFEFVKRAARAALDSDTPIWLPDAGESEESKRRLISGEVDSKAESPLESDLLLALKRHFPEPVLYRQDPDCPWRTVPAYRGELGTLVPQLKVHPYRGDFGIVGPVVRLFVEVDGYQFHDTTRDQLERDRKRDRYLMARGWRVCRFTGREVYQSPMRCAEEVIALLRGLE